MTAGLLVYRLLKSVDNYEVEILLSLALVAGGYALADALKLSAPIAMVVAGILIGNHGRKFAMSPTTIQHLDLFWELVDGVLNAVLFVILGLEVLVLRFNGMHLLAALIAIPVVISARWLSVGLSVVALSRWQPFDRHTVRILTWGGLARWNFGSAGPIAADACTRGRGAGATSGLDRHIPGRGIFDPRARNDAGPADAPLVAFQSAATARRVNCRRTRGRHLFRVGRCTATKGLMQMPEIQTKTTYLEMFEPPTRQTAISSSDFHVQRIDSPSIDYYRQLYRSVGASHYWVDRLVMPDEQLRSILHDERVDVFVLQVAGQTAGYSELDRRAAGEIELAYFGLLPSFIGRGLGKVLLDWTLRGVVASAKSGVGSYLRPRSSGRLADVPERRVSDLRRENHCAIRARRMRF